ncbi:MAG: hypothetical protein R3F61_28740 [Myxococcota bacterium]
MRTPSYRAVLLVLLVACKGTPTPVDTDTDVPDTDTDVPDTDTDVPTDPVLLAELDGPGATALCDTLEGLAPLTLDCGDYSLTYATEPVSGCEAAVQAVLPSCDRTDADVRACVEQLSGATCATDFSTDPCRGLFSPGCAPFGGVMEHVLGGAFGVQPDMPLRELTSSQLFAACLAYSDFPPTLVSCPQGDITILPTSVEECSGATPVPATCAATVGDNLACIDAILGGDCDALFEGTGACAPVNEPGCLP